MIRCVDLRIIINRHEECATNSKFDCSFLFTSAERLWLPPQDIELGCIDGIKKFLL